MDEPILETYSRMILRFVRNILDWIMWSGREDSNSPPAGSRVSAHVHHGSANKGVEPSSLCFENRAEHSQTGLNCDQLLHTHYTRWLVRSVLAE